MTRFDAELTDRLTRYAAIDSQSDAASASGPSTAAQWNILRLLADELTGIGAADVRRVGFGVVASS